MKLAIISVRFELADLALARAGAATLGLDFSAFVRMAALSMASQVRHAGKTAGQRKKVGRLYYGRATVTK